MGNHGKRSRRDGSSPSSSRIDPHKKPHSSSASISSPPLTVKHPTFISYLEAPNLHPKVQLLCEIIVNTPPSSVEKVLEDSCIRVSQEDVEDVLKLSYGFPGQAVKFFRWAGFQLNDKHSPYAWNLVVDMLGKNCLFDAMWDAIKSMKKEGLLSLATFASVFSSYVSANHVKEALMTFEVMGQYNVPRDVVALNSLLSAICRHGKTIEAKDFLGIAKDKIRPDADTYAILIEGFEGEGDASNARRVFSEMVTEIGWDPKNVPAYDSFLATLIKGPDGMREALKFLETMRDRRCFPGMKFFKIALEECARAADARAADLIWGALTKSGIRPDTGMYNSLIALHCYRKEIDVAKSLLDDMPYQGAFPDSQTYNLLFHFLIKDRKLKEASAILTEMTKNEFVPDQSNCSSAIRVSIDHGDPTLAIKFWKCMVEYYSSDLEETSNLLVLGLRDINRLPEAVKYAEDMIDRGIKLNSSTLSKLKQSLSKLGKEYVYGELLRKWKLK